MNPLLSVIVANFNHEKYLKDCIGSILSQSYTDFELIICDDHSTDHSREIIEQYKKADDRIKPLLQKSNAGVSINRHSGILKAEGKYITTLDSDDIYCHHDKLKAELNLIEYYEKHHHKAVCAFSKILRFDEQLNYIRDQWPDDKIKEGNIFKEIFSRSHLIPRDFTYLREAYFKAGGYDPRFNLYEDWDLKIRLAVCYEFYYTGIAGVGYRKKGEGLSYADPQEHVNTLKEILKKNYNLIDEKDRNDITGSIDLKIRWLEKQ